MPKTDLVSLSWFNFSIISLFVNASKSIFPENKTNIIYTFSRFRSHYKMLSLYCQYSVRLTSLYICKKGQECHTAGSNPLKAPD